jgi:YidC/Oxa1 family membrane protein insertase
MFKTLYNAVFFHPIYNILIGLYDVIPGRDIGLAIIVLTILVKVVLWPVSQKALVSQRALAAMQPKVAELKERYKEKDQQEQLAKELMTLYSREKVSPMSSCLPLVIQLPVFLALYASLRAGLHSVGFDHLYPFIPNPGTITPTLLGLVDLSAPNIVLAVMAAITQFFQAKMMVAQQQPKGIPGGKDEEMLASMNRNMLYVMPVMTLFVGIKLPGGLALYWFTMNLLTVVQQRLYFTKKTAEAEKKA